MKTRKSFVTFFLIVIFGLSSFLFFSSPAKAADSWSTGTAGGTARAYHTSVLYNGKIYSWGGVDMIGTVFNTLDIYDIATDSWSTGTAGGTARQIHTSVLYNGKIYSWAGKNSSKKWINTIDIYDIASDSWSTGTAGGTARSDHTSVLYSGKIYSWGGCDDRTGVLNTLDIYDTGVQPVYANLPGDTRPINLDEGQTITSSPYTLKVKPETGSGITKVEFYIDDVLICTDTTPDSDGVYSCDWDTTRYHSTVKVITYYESNEPITLTRNATVLSSTIQTGTILPETGADNRNQNNVYIVAAITSLIALALIIKLLKTKKDLLKS